MTEPTISREAQEAWRDGLDAGRHHAELDRLRVPVALSDDEILALLSEHTTFDLQVKESESEVDIVMNKYGHTLNAQRFLDFARALLALSTPKEST